MFVYVCVSVCVCVCVFTSLCVCISESVQCIRGSSVPVQIPGSESLARTAKKNCANAMDIGEPQLGIR